MFISLSISRLSPMHAHILAFSPFFFNFLNISKISNIHNELLDSLAEWTGYVEKVVTPPKCVLVMLSR